jgi:hypothetical protein
MSGDAELGELASIHPIAGAQQVVRVVLGVVCVLAALGLVAGAIDGGAPVGRVATLQDRLFFLVPALGFAYGAFYARRHWKEGRGQRVEVFAGGLAIVEPRGTVRIRWKEIAEVYAIAWESPQPVPCTGVMRLVLSDHTIVDLPSPLARPFDLGEAILRGTQERFLDEAEAALAAGRPVRFGPVLLDSQRRIDGAEVRGSRLVSSSLELLLDTGRTLLHPTETVANLGVLMALLARRRAERVPA